METKIKNQQLLVETLTNLFLEGLREISTSSPRMSEQMLTLRRNRFKERLKRLSGKENN